MKNYKLKDILIPFVAFLAIFGLLIYVFAAISNIFDLYDKVSKYTENIAVYQDNISRLSTISTTEISNKVNIYNVKIPLGGDIANLVNDSIKLANSFGLEAQKDIKKTDTKKDDTKASAVDVEDLQSGDLDVIPESALINGLVYPINLSLTVKGSKANILSYTQSLSGQSRILNVMRSSMSLISADNKKDEWTAHLTIFAYAVNVNPTSKINKKITDPLDSQLLNPPKRINTNVD